MLSLRVIQSFSSHFPIFFSQDNSQIFFSGYPSLTQDFFQRSFRNSLCRVFLEILHEFLPIFLREFLTENFLGTPTSYSQKTPRKVLTRSPVAIFWRNIHNLATISCRDAGKTLGVIVGTFKNIAQKGDYKNSCKQLRANPVEEIARKSPWKTSTRAPAEIPKGTQEEIQVTILGKSPQ